MFSGRIIIVVASSISMMDFLVVAATCTISAMDFGGGVVVLGTCAMSAAVVVASRCTFSFSFSLLLSPTGSESGFFRSQCLLVDCIILFLISVLVRMTKNCCTVLSKIKRINQKLEISFCFRLNISF